MWKSKSSWVESYRCKDMRIMWSSAQLGSDTYQNASGCCGRVDILTSKSRTPIILSPCVCSPFRTIVLRISINTSPTTFWNLNIDPTDHSSPRPKLHRLPSMYVPQPPLYAVLRDV